MVSDRLDQLPPYLFVEIDRLKEKYAGSGRPVLDLGIGDPDLRPAPELIDSLVSALDNPRHHRYPDDLGLPLLRDAIRRWAHDTYGISLGDDEILVTIGSKEAIAHLPLAVVNAGDTVLVPDPGYPVYNSGAVFAGAHVHRLPIEEQNRFWPDLKSVDRGVLAKARLLFLNYPNNPTAAMATKAQFEEAASLCGENGIILVNDAAYSEITYDTPFVPLFPHARRSGASFAELYSFSKTFSITGWRVGFAIGSPDVIGPLARLKANIDSGVFGAIQEAMAIGVSSHYAELTERVRAVYRERRDALGRGLEESGLDFTLPEATFYFWIACPWDMDSISFCARLLEETGIVATPGIGFGEYGEGYFRLSITSELDTITRAAEHLASLPSLMERIRKD
jgi:LL-diaminopimelate aminotransferase